MHGPVLFLIYVNNIDEGLTWKVSKFTADTKVMNKVVTSEDKRQLQSDLDRRVTWSDKWQLSFKADKCEVLHVDSNNDHNNYSMNSSGLVKVNEATDLGVNITSDLASSKHWKEVVKTANKLLGCIDRTFECHSEGGNNFHFV